MEMDTSVVVALAVLVVVISKIGKIVKNVVWDPYMTCRHFRKQGVPYIPYSPLVGNVAEIGRITADVRSKPLPFPAAHQADHVASYVLPHYHHWKNIHGDPFVFWLGPGAILTVPNPEMVKEILSNKFGHFTLIDLNPEAKALIGGSIASLNGERWAQHRRIVSPAFFLEKIKVMTPTMVSCINEMLDKWGKQLNGKQSIEMNISEEFKVLTADIIAKTAFGSNYKEGKRVFEIQHEQLSLLAEFGHSFNIPGSRFLPTSHNRRLWRLQKEIQTKLREIIRNHGDETNDLLGILLAANRKELSGSQTNLSLTIQEIVDTCKMFYLAGYETTATLLTWITMLLAVNPEWQERTREEAIQACSSESSSYESFHKLKLAGMVINEALRMYPPAPLIMRQTVKKMKLGNIVVPRKTMLFIPVVSIHHDPEFWGPDASEFNPQRFADGISNASTTPSAYFPFSMGPRTCLGQSFALLEARAALAMMLRRFRFSLSPGYKHAPLSVLTIQPQYGMQIILEKL